MGYYKTGEPESADNLIKKEGTIHTLECSFISNSEVQ